MSLLLKQCIECQITFLAKRKRVNFCSKSCGAKFNNKKVKIPDHPCKICGSLTSYRNTYCSHRCHQSDPQTIYYFDIQGWLKGKIEGGTNSSSLGGCRTAVRRYLLEESNHQCSKCGWGEVHPITGKVPLEINHIDGNAHNNKRENLEVLCPNCHSLTPNFRGLNKKSSRTHR